MVNKPLMGALSEKFQTRCAAWSDIDSIVNLRNASSQDTRGTNVTAAHWQKRHWYDSSLDLETDSLLILAGDNAVAFVELSSEAPYVVYELTGVVHPDFRGQGLGTYLINWAKNRVWQTNHQAPAGAAVFIQSSIFDSNQPGRALLQSRGYTVVRDFVHLQIHMDAKPPAPVWPPGIEVRPLLVPNDWEKVGPALHEAFKDHWGIIEYEKQEQPDSSSKSPAKEMDPEAFDEAYFNSPGLCYVAWDGDQVVGSCLCNASTVEFPQAGYLGSLSTRRAWRQRGIGLALTLQALNAFYKRGTTHVLTDTDGDSLTKAYRIYQKVGMEIFRHEYVYEKIICPGRDLVKRNLG